MKRTAQAVLLLAVALLMMTSGCYTVLRHPTGSHIVQEGSYYRSCADCHADAAFYHPYGHPYYRYGRSHYSWGGYYGSPWWYNDYWWWDDHHYYDDDDYEYDGPETETGTRHLWGTGGWPSSGWGFNPPTGDAVSPQVRPPTPPKLKDAQEKPDKDKQKPPTPRDIRPDQQKTKQKKDKDDEPEKPDRNDAERKDKLRPRKNPSQGS
jgi:hypothetical protein